MTETFSCNVEASNEDDLQSTRSSTTYPRSIMKNTSNYSPSGSNSEQSFKENPSRKTKPEASSGHPFPEIQTGNGLPDNHSDPLLPQTISEESDYPVVYTSKSVDRNSVNTQTGHTNSITQTGQKGKLTDKCLKGQPGQTGKLPDNCPKGQPIQTGKLPDKCSKGQPGQTGKLPDKCSIGQPGQTRKLPDKCSKGQHGQTGKLPDKGSKNQSGQTNPLDTNPKGKIVETIDSLNLESDLESEADFFRKFTQRETSHESDFAEESILSPEEDDDEGEFQVHFVHHGKKVEDTNAMQSDLLFQINELQEAVISMKSSLTEAVTKLSMVEGTSPSAEVEDLRRKCEGNSAEILKMVLTLKTDFSTLRQDVSVISKRQEAIQKSLFVLLEDRKLLANDLIKSNVISSQTRSRLDSTLSLIDTGGHSGSGSHSNDSGVALLLEKTQNAFGDDSGPLQLSGQRVSDQDSLPEQPSLLVPPSVYDYVAGLSHHTSSVSSNAQFCSHDGLSTPANDDSNALQVKDEPDEGRRDSFDLGTVYDSDSSLTVAANKTISLSTCISQEIRVHEASYPTTPSSTHYSASSEGVKGDKRESRADCETPSPSKEKVSSQNRRRRPLLGVSSTKMYLATSHCHPSSVDKDHHKLRHRYISKGGDPREAQRYKLAKELVDTEKQYCKTLWTIQDVFAEPLKKSGILSPKDIITLFPEEVYHLYDKHCFLQHQLKERLASWKWQPLIGDILARFTDPQQCEVLRLYTSYVNDFPQILKTFHKLCHSSQPFTDFIKRCLDQPACRGLDLGAFLLTPVQRVPKYILLLKQLLKYTSSSHPDHRHIGIVLERLRDFLSRLNSAMEESFLIVNSSLSPPIGPSSGGSGASGGSGGSVLSVVPLGVKYRNGKNTRKSCSSSKDNIVSSSPSNRRNRHTRIYQPSSASPGVEYRSPKRSSSMACGTDSPHKSPSKHIYSDRSASLPRGFTSMSSDSPDSSGDGQESSPERNLKGGSKMRHYSTQDSSYHHRSKYPSLTPARSVSNVLSDLHLETPLEGLASSEPSLIEKSKMANTKILSKKSTPSNVTPMLNETASNNAHKLVHWTDSVESAEDKKKKSSIKSSLKNMFNFKKRPVGHQNSREEPFYVSSSIILETPGEYSPTHTQYNQPQRPPTATQSGSSNGNGESSSTSAQSRSPVAIGDFLDEEGNPCSNV